MNFEDYQSVTHFLDLIPQDTLAVASFRSKAYTRAVMHFESFIIEKKQNIQEHLGFLQVWNWYTKLLMKINIVNLFGYFHWTFYVLHWVCLFITLQA